MEVCREKHCDRETRRDGLKGLGVEPLVLNTLSTQHVISLFYSVILPPCTTIHAAVRAADTDLPNSFFVLEALRA